MWRRLCPQARYAAYGRDPDAGYSQKDWRIANRVDDDEIDDESGDEGFDHALFLGEGRGYGPAFTG